MSNRRLFEFSLLMLLLACIPACSQTLTPRETAIVEFEKLGGTFEGGFLDLKGSKVTDTELAHLKILRPKVLNLSGTQVTDAGLVHLKELTELKGLFLSDTKVTDAGLAHLKDLSNLERLHLGNTNVTDAGLIHLKGLTKLNSLDLNDTKVSDAGLVHLKELTELRELILLNTKISDAGLVHFKDSKLQFLMLGGTQVTDVGFSDLEKALPKALHFAVTLEMDAT